jgi:hypothetical protein
MATYFKTLSITNVAAGGSGEVKWTTDRDLTVRKLMAIERSDKSLSNVQVYIAFAGTPYTKDFIPGSAIGSNPEYCYKPNLSLPKGTEVYIKLTNSRSDSVSVDFVFEVE